MRDGTDARALVLHAGGEREHRLPAAGHHAHEHQLGLLRRGQQRQPRDVVAERRGRVRADAQIDGVDRPRLRAGLRLACVAEAPPLEAVVEALAELASCVDAEPVDVVVDAELVVVGVGVTVATGVVVVDEDDEADVVADEDDVAAGPSGAAGFDVSFGVLPANGLRGAPSEDVRTWRSGRGPAREPGSGGSRVVAPRPWRRSPRDA